MVQYKAHTHTLCSYTRFARQRAYSRAFGLVVAVVVVVVVVAAMVVVAMVVVAEAVVAMVAMTRTSRTI
jgi:hypothetical protein